MAERTRQSRAEPQGDARCPNGTTNAIWENHRTRPESRLQVDKPLAQGEETRMNPDVKELFKERIAETALELCVS